MDELELNQDDMDFVIDGFLDGQSPKHLAGYIRSIRKKCCNEHDVIEIIRDKLREGMKNEKLD